MSIHSRIISTALTLLLASSAFGQNSSAYPQITLETDGYKGSFHKVTIEETQYTSMGESSGHNTKETEYDQQGRTTFTTAVFSNAAGRTVTTEADSYVYKDGEITRYNIDGVDFQLILNSDGTIAEQKFFSADGKLEAKDTYSYSGDEISQMKRTDGKGKSVSVWQYTRDSLDNITATNEDGTKSFTWSPEGVLLREYTNDGSTQETTYTSEGFIATEKDWSYPNPMLMMGNNVPVTESFHEYGIIRDKDDRIKEVYTNTYTKNAEKWYDPDGRLFSVETRNPKDVMMTWYYYRYDGQIAEVQKEHWVSPSADNPNGYFSEIEEYMYNNRDQLSSLIVYDETGSEKNNVFYTYGSNGRLFSSSSSSSPEDKDWYSWDSNGNLLTQLKCSSGNDYFSTVLDEYTYDEQGRQTSKVTTLISKLYNSDLSMNDQYSDRIEYTYSYNQEGLLERTQTVYSDRTVTDYLTYDGDGRLYEKLSLSVYPDGTVHRTDLQYLYEMEDDYLKEIEYTVTHSLTLYTYNQEGNPNSIRKYDVQREPEGSRNVLILSRHYSYE